MKLLKKRLFCLLAACAVLTVFCLISGCESREGKNLTEGKPTVVATTTMLRDLAEQLGGDRVTVLGLMGCGVDPHQYRASAGDMTKMQGADMIVYSGLHLEGKMGEVFAALEDKKTVCASDGIPEEKLIINGNAPDPHIWFDVSLWKEAARTVEDGLCGIDPEGSDYYGERLESYLEELDRLDGYIKEKTNEIPKEKRVLITAHDAFGYFGNAYGFEVRGLQGISTVSEAGAADVSRLAEYIADNRIGAVFVESSLPVKNIEALIEAVRARGFETSLGGSLYSDSIGDAESGTDTYIAAFKHNIDTIAEGLCG
ncbi:MAG: zinc ABC transporter substrate-binding protein [Bacteroides sp.]|nr:zinc ABC transporter substrate-binding protein [Bacteroides sp.]